jgi:CBS domain-containing protein
LVVDANSPFLEAATMMSDGNVEFLLVCSLSTGKVLGTMSDREIAIRLVASEMSPRVIAGELAMPETVFCRISTDVKQTLRLMREDRAARLLCVDESGRLAEVQSLSDIGNKVPKSAAGMSAAEPPRPATSKHKFSGYREQSNGKQNYPSQRCASQGLTQIGCTEAGTDS